MYGEGFVYQPTDFTVKIFKDVSVLTLKCSILQLGPPGVLGIWGEWLLIFRELGSTGNYFRGAREQAHNFGDLVSLAIKRKKKIRKNLHFV